MAALTGLVLAGALLLAAGAVQAQTEVPSNWALKPSGLSAGDDFRLLVVTSTTADASFTSIGDYDSIVQNAVANGHASIRRYKSGFKVLGSTRLPTVAARNHTGTTYTATNKGVPIYYLNGAKVADNYEDFYDGSWDTHSPKTESGTATTATRVWTGTNSNGTGSTDNALGRPFAIIGMPISYSVVYGDPTSSTANHVLNRGTDSDKLYPLYGLSQTFRVGAVAATTPASPSSFTATPGNRQVALSWTAPGSDGGAAITRYQVSYSPGGSWRDVPDDGYTVTGLNNGTAYTFYVRAWNSVGASATRSATATPSTNNAPTFTEGDSATRSLAENTVAGENIGTPIAATDTDGDTLTYTLGGTDANNFDLVTTDGKGQLRTKTGVTYDFETKTSYSVIVRVSDGNGGSDSITVTINISDVNEPPSAPAAPMVTSGSTTTSLSVSWTDPTNTGPDIMSYDLQYRQGTTGNFTTGPQTVTGTRSSITGLTHSTRYQVQVRATNAEGTGSWSASGDGTTSTPPQQCPDLHRGCQHHARC